MTAWVSLLVGLVLVAMGLLIRRIWSVPGRKWRPGDPFAGNWANSLSYAQSWLAILGGLLFVASGAYRVIASVIRGAF